jgi:hypothetical protein
MDMQNIRFDVSSVSDRHVFMLHRTFDVFAAEAIDSGYADYSFDNCMTLDAVATAAVGCECAEPHVI